MDPVRRRETCWLSSPANRTDESLNTADIVPMLLWCFSVSNAVPMLFWCCGWEMLCQCCFNAGPASQTLGQHQNNIINSYCLMGLHSNMICNATSNGIPAKWHPKMLYQCGSIIKYFCISHADQRLLSIWNHHKGLSQLFPIHLNTYIMGLWTLWIFWLLHCGDWL